MTESGKSGDTKFGRALVGYSDRLSVRAGERIDIFVSSFGPDRYRAELVRLLGDDGKAKLIDHPANKDYPARRQEIYAGSCVIVDDCPALSRITSFSLQILCWPTLPRRGRQWLIGKRQGTDGPGFALMLEPDGSVSIEIADGARQAKLNSGGPLLAREWYRLQASFDAASGLLRLWQLPFHDHLRQRDRRYVETPTELRGCGADNGADLTLAAQIELVADGRLKPSHRFNGKLEAPRLADCALGEAELARLAQATPPADLRSAIAGAWDFARDIPSVRVRDLGDHRLDGRIHNLPVRAMKGHNWDGSARDWTKAPQHYGAIHFRENDLYDAGWQKDFSLDLPADLPSGCYSMRLTAGAEVEFVPFFVRPAPGAKRAAAAFLVPSCSYMAYANERTAFDAFLLDQGTGHVAHLGPEDIFLNAHREYGYSFYDCHEDGSGSCHSSRLRPILNMRPGHRTSWVGGAGDGAWQFPADLDIVEWLESQAIAYDVVTDEDLHREGLAAIQPYRALLTGSHPEYHSTEMIDAIQAYTRQGGRLMYLGANGFYWRIAFHRELPGVIELRRTEDGVRDWQAEPGEYHHGFSGEYGGLWRRIGRPPQSTAGVGFVAQGFDVSSSYRRRPDSFDPRAAFIFEGVGKEEKIGDFGRIGGAAAGWELDAADRALGTPPHALLLASSEGHSNVYLMVPEEVHGTIPAISGIDCATVRADIVFYEMPMGGAVFATGSIAWAGSLNHEGGRNNVSRITGNVLRRFIDPTPFATKG